MELTTALAVLFLSFLAYWIYKGVSKPANFPPGPAVVPLLDSIPFLPSLNQCLNPLTLNQRLREKYGDLVGYNLGSNFVVVMSDRCEAQEVFKQDVALGRNFSPFHACRPGYESGKRISGTGPGILMSADKEWVEVRKFSLRHLRTFGFGKSSMEDSFNEEIARVAAILEREAGRPFDPHLLFNGAIFNALWYMLVSERFEDLEDPELKRLMGLVETTLDNFGNLGALLIGNPALAGLPLLTKLTKYGEVKDALAEIASIMKPQIEQHLSTIDAAHPRDFLDVLIANVSECEDPQSFFFQDKGHSSIMNVLIDFFLGGSETVSSSLLWGFLYMIHFPDIQEKVQKELDDAFERGGKPTYQSSKEALPFTHAVIAECYRKTSLAHMGIPHRALEKIKVGAFVIPKDAIVVQNLYHIHHDPDTWAEPHKFDPARFLDQDGKFANYDKIDPFGIGRRYCPGQSLAEQEFFSFFTGVLHRFRLRRVPGDDLPGISSFGSANGLGRFCPRFKMILEPRC